jgi:septum formation protein
MPLWRAADALVLASGSAPRRVMLEAADIPIEVRPPDIDERSLEAVAGSLDPPGAAVLLAREKARSVSRRMPSRLVVGADQTLALGSKRFDKPRDRTAARDQLKALAGDVHRLHAAVAVARDGTILFEDVDSASLTMRPLSDGFLDTYLEAAGDAVLASVGGYQLERLGIHLFARVEGDHFTILGLPLLKLLEFLRREGSLAQ